MKRTGEKLVKFKEPMLSELQTIATAEGRTFSELIREACRHYIYRVRQERPDLLKEEVAANV